MNAPCKDCKDRERLCHSKCEKYIAYKEERAKENAIRANNVIANDTAIRSIYRVRKKTNAIRKRSVKNE